MKHGLMINSSEDLVLNQRKVTQKPRREPARTFLDRGVTPDRRVVRGVRGGNENEGNLTGSATVRIIRPPAEAGSVPMKLEKVKTLDNDGVIAMIDAGFSEGTIIKRIEDSPVDFDLSPSKVAELHKRRVTDAIIAAMTAAMGDAPTKQTSRQPERDN